MNFSATGQGAGGWLFGVDERPPDRGAQPRHVVLEHVDRQLDVDFRVLDKKNLDRRIIRHRVTGYLLAASPVCQGILQTCRRMATSVLLQIAISGVRRSSNRVASPRFAPACGGAPPG